MRNVLLGLIVAWATAGFAQDGPVIVPESQPDASNVFDQADQVNEPFGPLVQVTGELVGGQDADTYRYLPSNWSLPVLTSVWTSTFQADGTQDGGHLFTRTNDVIEYSLYSSGIITSLVYSVVKPAQKIEIGVTDFTSSRSQILYQDPDRLEPDDSGNNFSKSYSLRIDEARPHQQIDELTQLNQRDASRITSVADCSADLLRWRYQDLDPSVINESGEQIYAGVVLSRNCLAHGFQFRSQAIVGVVVMNPQTGFVYLARKYDADDEHPIGETSQYFKDWAPVIQPGELAALVPAGDPDPVLLMGTIVFDSNGEPNRQSGCNTCLRNYRSAHPMKNSIVAIEIIKPSISYDLNQLVVTEIAGEDSLEVAIPVASSDQMFAFDLVITRLQNGQYTKKGDIIASDTLRAITPQNAVSRLHASGGYTLTKRFAISDLRPGDQIQINATLRGRGLYNDNTVQPQFAQSVKYVLQTGTPVDNTPENLEFTTSIYPNPSTGDRVTLAVTSAGGQVTYAVFDVQGRQVISGQQTLLSGETQISLDLSGVAPGVYAYRVQQNTGVARGRLSVVR